MIMNVNHYEMQDDFEDSVRIPSSRLELYV